MKLTDENKAHIDNLTYEQLLSKWRFSPVGDPWFQDETGDYWAARMSDLRNAGANHVAASKSIGWEQ